ncbi:MAG: hypothetical protein SPJ92_07880 [Bariatricus sp.]|nr:hypothetical protein [Bariatricus sp.]
MDLKLPYYMTYPMPFLYDDEKEVQRDYEYLRSMYPELAKKILPYVEEECDRLDYEGSMIFDEYPDKLQLRLICSRVYEKWMENANAYEMDMVNTGVKEQAEAQFQRRRKPDRIRDIIDLLTFHELMRRRNRHREERRKRYW